MSEERPNERPLLTRILHDGVDTWYIETPDSIELSHPGSVTLVRKGVIEMYRDVNVAINNSYKTLLQPRLMAYLGHATGEVKGSELAVGRLCWRVDVWNLRRNEDTVFRMLIDAEIGVVMSSRRDDLESPQSRIVELNVGTSMPSERIH